jgi:aspartate aminotransferase
MVEYAGGKSVVIRAGVDQQYKFTAEQLETAITPKTKLIIFSSPCNPSGAVFNQAELQAIAAVLEKHPHVFVISDEIYEKINYCGPHVSIASFPGMKERTAVVNGLAKGYAMTGWRIGYLAGPAWLVSACEKMQGLFTSGANSISQMAGIAALEGDQKPVEDMRQAFLGRRNRILELLKSIPGLEFDTPDGAFYVFPDVSYYLGKTAENTLIDTAEKLCFYLLNEAGVACVGGTAFGLPGCIRISYATDIDTIEKAVARLKDAFSKIN